MSAVRLREREDSGDSRDCAWSLGPVVGRPVEREAAAWIVGAVPVLSSRRVALRSFPLSVDEFVLTDNRSQFAPTVVCNPNEPSPKRKVRVVIS